MYLIFEEFLKRRGVKKIPRKMEIPGGSEGGGGPM